ncbi:hypothetical protein M3Y99_01216900 [Aphelenchoides fujianensis]|nr:hypothetical protein M3Y99_01216900 [Aphelenchoides fujianensis]
MFQRVRHGTVLMPFEARICAKFPGQPPLQLVDPQLVGADGNELNTTRPFDSCIALGQRPSKSSPLPKTTGFPSVSLISGAISDKRALYRWQLQMVRELGPRGLRDFCLRRMRGGSLFHKVVESQLQELQSDERIQSNAVDVLREQKDGAAYEKELEGALGPHRRVPAHARPESLSCSWRSRPATHFLCYTGRFDAIVELDGELTLVDWKTVNSESTKSSSSEQKLPADLYDNPVQLAAYVASVNCSPLFCDLPLIKQAAVVLVYEDGRAVEVVKVNAEQIEHYFGEFRRRLNEFWWRMENEKPRAGVIQLTYNPATAPAVPKATGFAN